MTQFTELLLTLSEKKKKRSVFDKNLKHSEN